MRTIRLQLIAANLLVSALLCAGAIDSACAAEAAANRTPAAVYLEPDAVDLIRLLGPPPAPGSDAQARELATLHAAQESRSAADIARVQADARINIISAFAGVLGSGFKEENLPLLTQFFRNVSRSTGSFIGAAKDCWSRPRPFATDTTIVPPPGLKESAGMRADSSIPKVSNPRCIQGTEPSQYSYSYPSGHSTFGAMTAIQLADMVPEQRQAIFERGWEFGYRRIVAGVHYPSDVEAGRIQATVMVALMQKNPSYQRDFAAARQELRKVLGYPD